MTLEIIAILWSKLLFSDIDPIIIDFKFYKRNKKDLETTGEGVHDFQISCLTHDWIEEDKVTGGTHADVYISTSLSGKKGVIKYMVLQTWDFL